MVKELYKTTALAGLSGNNYVFSLWSFDDFDDIKGMFRGEGLYLFTQRYRTGNVYRHRYIYLGESANFFSRFDNHHKESDIRAHFANCIGFYSMSNATEEERIKAEKDLLDNFNFPCNITNNQ